MAHLGKLAGAVALTLAATLPVAAPAQAAPDVTDNKIQVIQHNTDAQGPGPAIAAAADWGGVDAITYQELCKNQIDDVQAAGYRVHWSQHRARTKNSCRKVVAVASTHRFANTDTYGVGTFGRGKKKRTIKLVCADLRGTGVARTTVCTSHFPLDYNGKAAPSGLQNRIKVADRIRAIVNRKISAGRRVVLTGDFNSKPRTAPLTRFYRAHGNGRFWEGDQRCGKSSVCRDMKPTTSSGGKLDYVFASSPGVNRLNGVSKLAVKKYDRSGHFVIRGSVKFGSLR
jgi:endonuclease/exonuclease/phosphatase (EEP) superfamily protein YafD